ncbi:MAG: class I mannose-6-phosphate isomerase [Sphingobacteriales bacterium]
MNLNQSSVSDQRANTGISVRKSSQAILPAKLLAGTLDAGDYNIYPVSHINGDKINNGFGSLAQWIISKGSVVIDGFGGVFWGKIKAELDVEFNKHNLSVNWVSTADFLKSETEVGALLKPFLGTEESVWGSKCTLQLSDIFRNNELSAQKIQPEFEINIMLGTGAALSNWHVPIVYIDLPKNEVQFRMRAGSITNLGSNSLYEPYIMYKRFYFVDWVLLNQHKKQILDNISVIADGQWGDDINWMLNQDFAAALNTISNSVIRVRPWFEPGAWGGQWIKEHIKGINKDVINYAWSFELIVPENGLIFESGRFLLEVSFDFLMFRNQQQVLGKHTAKFGDEFPIRFDFLDTCKGGNLSIQCHPRLKYIQQVFGETITQDETYYILDCEPEANVYLGFQENIDPIEYRAALETSQTEGKEISIENYVQSHLAKKHDLFLIPNGTVHSAGAGNLVLEISATPYIFTFKMYDWLRLDLDGNPRPINIEHAFNNLDFDRKGDVVQQDLISKQTIIEKGDNWQLIHLPTHAEHFYDVHRIEFDDAIIIETNNCCHVLMLVEGEWITIETADGSTHHFAYAETFVVPAAAISYKLTNKGAGRAKVIKSFLK